MALNITPGRRRVLEAVGRGELIKLYHYETWKPDDFGAIRYTGKRGPDLMPRNLEHTLYALDRAELLELPANRHPADNGGSMRRYRLTDTGRAAIEPA